MTQRNTMPDWKIDIRERLAPLALPPDRELEIGEELSQHLDDRYHELRSAGASDEAARRDALDELNDADLAQGLIGVERAMPADVGTAGGPGGIAIKNIGRDVRYAIRSLRKSPRSGSVSRSRKTRRSGMRLWASSAPSSIEGSTRAIGRSCMCPTASRCSTAGRCGRCISPCAPRPIRSTRWRRSAAR